MALRSLARAMMQLFPTGVLLVTSSFTETMARATSVGVGIGFTAPIPFGSIDACVVGIWIVSCVISTTMHGGPEQTTGRVSKLRTGPQLSPPRVTRHVFAIGIVKPFSRA